MDDNVVYKPGLRLLKQISIGCEYFVQNKESFDRVLELYLSSVSLLIQLYTESAIPLNLQWFLITFLVIVQGVNGPLGNVEKRACAWWTPSLFSKGCVHVAYFDSKHFGSYSVKPWASFDLDIQTTQNWDNRDDEPHAFMHKWRCLSVPSLIYTQTSVLWS